MEYRYLELDIVGKQAKFWRSLIIKKVELR